MITIYDAKAEDFSTLGLGTLEPDKCEIEERAGGLYELLIRHPITDDMRAFLLQNDRIIKAEAPMRETPQISIDAQGGQTVQREIWRVNTSGDRLHLRAKPNGRIIGAYPNGTKVVKYGESSVSGWWGVIVCDGGAKGYMYSQYLTYDSTQTDVIRGDTPGVVVEPRQTREQLFRIYSVVQDGAGKFIEARARHISYDIAGACVGLYKVKNAPANEICARLTELADHDAGINIICGVTDVLTGDFSGKNLLECLLDPDTGIAAQTKAKVVRDNFDIFLLPDEERDRGVEIRYGKNLLAAQLETDATDVVTRIIPVGTDAEGNDLYGEPVDSARIGEYPVVRTAVVQYDVEVNEETTQEQALEQLRAQAQMDMDAGCDLMAVRLDAQFVRLELAQEYAELANAYALHLYDSVPVIDREAGIDVKVRMVGYTYDALLKRYTTTELGDISAIGTTIYGYELADGSIGGTKIVNGTITGGKLRDLSVGYAKISAAAIEHLSADALKAVRADIHKLVAGEITTDELYADLAHIAKAEITYADIKELDVEVARITKAEISVAEIDGAKIKSATIDSAKIALGAITAALIEKGAVGEAQIADGSITDAKIVSLNADVITAGTLSVDRLLLKGENGLFREINATDSGLTVQELSQEQYQNAISGTVLVARSITADKIAAKSITSNEILAGTITAAEINVVSLFAAEASITAIENVILRTETIEALKGELNVWADEKISLEVNDTLDGYTPTGIVDGSRLIITKEQTHIDTPQFSVNVNGTNGDMTLDENGLAADVISSPSVRPMYTGPDTMTVSTGVLMDSNAVLGVDGFVTLSDAFAKLSGKYLPYEVTINVGTVAVDGTNELWYTDGAPINILGLNKTINGRLAFSHTRNQINISGLNLSYAGGDNPVTLQDCYSVVFSNCIFTVSRALNSWSNAFYANQSHVEFYSCGFFGGYAGLFIEKNAHAVVDSCYGSGNDYGIFARNNAQIGVVTSRPYGAAGTYATADSVVRGATATSTGTAPSTPTQTTTVELDCTDSRTYAGGWYNSSTPMVAQGVVNGTTFRGYMWFDFSSVRGKTIQRAAIRLYRKSSIGKNREVDVYIGAMNCAGPGNTISSMMNYGKITVAGPKEQIKASIPTEMLQAIANGTYNGVFVHSQYADDYAAFDGVGEAHPPALLVTY